MSKACVIFAYNPYASAACRDTFWPSLHDYARGDWAISELSLDERDLSQRLVTGLLVYGYRGFRREFRATKHDADLLLTVLRRCHSWLDPLAVSPVPAFHHPVFYAPEGRRFWAGEV